MATPALPDLLTLLEERAPRLRKAGVLALELADAGVKVQFAPELLDMPGDVVTGKNETKPASNPLFDARTYGLPEGAKLPGFDPPDPDDDENAEDVDEHGRPLGADLDED